ncbi:MAG: hypothetical protein P8J45_11915 [Phycisphaerales bacterium]|jgi:hypothetical protein|nr:hypothetical protein [Phycisphaerales bacterium]
MFRSTLAATATTAGLLAGIAHADTTLVVPEGSSAGVNVTLSIETFLGPDEDTDSGTVNIDESQMTVDPNPGSEPFTSMLITEHVIYTSGGDLSFCFYPIFGSCSLTLAVDVDQLDVTLTNDLNVSVDGSGNWAAASANYDLVMTLSYDGGALIGSGTAEATAAASISVSGNVDLDNGVLQVTQLELETIDIQIDPNTLPDGLDALQVVVETDFTDVVYSGSLNPCDLDGDGAVGGADLTILLGQWGSCCTGDLDGNGLVDGADLTILLSCWTA